MFKAVFLGKRRPGMSFEEFRDYYETNHRKLGEMVLPTASHYSRRYLTPVPFAMVDNQVEAEYDVITEVWFEDRETFDKSMAAIADPKITAMLAEDEEKFFDRSKNRMMIVEEFVSKLPNN